MKKLFFALSIIAIVVIFSQSACYYDNEAEQYGVTPCDTVSISYIADIKPIVDANCISCHAPGGQQESSPFTNYDEIKLYTSDRQIVDRVYGNGAALMPPSGSLSDCAQLKIQAWVNAGSPNN